MFDTDRIFRYRGSIPIPLFDTDAQMIVLAGSSSSSCGGGGGHMGILAPGPEPMIFKLEY